MQHVAYLSSFIVKNYYHFILLHGRQAGIYTEVNKEASKVQGYSKAVTTLLVANAYEQDDLQGEEL